MLKDNVEKYKKMAYNDNIETPVRCDCGRIVAVKDTEGNITVKCKRCNRIIKVFRAENP